jgi:hypothetical protein
MLSALALLAALQAAPATAAGQSLPPEPKAYITRFCAPIAISEPDGAVLRQHYADWSARMAGEDQAQAFRPQDADVPGQMVSFDAPGAPHAFVDRRRGMCSLIYTSAHTPDSVIADLHGGLNLAGHDVQWRQVTTKRVGRPGPIRYFMPGSDDGRFGLCATLFEDLRLHDATPATMVRVETCRLGPDDTLG